MLKNYNSQSDISIISLNEDNENPKTINNIPSNKIKTLAIDDDNDNDDNGNRNNDDEIQSKNSNESINNKNESNDIKNSNDLNSEDISNEEEISTIKIFSRIRPSKYKVPNRYWITKPEEDVLNEDKPLPKIGFLIPRNESQGLINNQKEKHEFKFDRVFDKDTKQEEIFDVVAKDVVLRYKIILFLTI